MLTSFRGRLAFFAIQLFCFAAASFAQATGRLTGTVTDPAGAAVPGAKVSLYIAGGQSAILGSVTGAAGNFDFPALRAGSYDVSVESSGFAKFVQRQVKIDASRETALPHVVLEVATISQTVEVTEAVANVQTTTFEVASTVTQAQVANLPVLDRQIANLFSTQAGVGSNGQQPTVINGLRPSFTALTLDGINVQDNWVRTNTLDFVPNRVTVGQVAEMTVNVSNSNPALGGGAAQIAMVTPSGTNSYHGSLYWYNRNSKFAATDWFNNQNGLGKSRLNLNQAGGTIGGPIKKDKLLFYGNYELYRRHSQTSVLNRVLTPSARQGIFRYRQGADVREFNVLQASNLTMDPLIQQLLGQVPATGNSSQTGDSLNTTGYSFLARSNILRDVVMGKGDYYMTSNHAFAGTFMWNRDQVDRPGLGNFYTQAPPVSNDNSAKLLSVAWRWTARPALTNELRGGFNRSQGPFKVANPVPALVISGLSFTSPINARLPEGRNTRTYSLQDNANWLRGKHSLSFGYQSQFMRTSNYDATGTVADYTVGISANSPYGFTAGQFPGLNATQVGQANTLLASLGGIVATATRNFNPTGPGSGFVAGAPLSQNFSQDNHALYLTESWKVLRRLTLVMGLRWDYYTVVSERDSLQLQPVAAGGNGFDTLLSNATLDLHGKSVGRPLYGRDWNNFAPNFGFAWDVFGDGKTALRGGYSVAYSTDNTGNSIINTLNANAGLTGTTSFINLNDSLRSPRPLPPPAFKIPLTARDTFIQTNGNNTLGMVDPNLATPYTQQWSLGIQREVKGFLIEGRYIGNHTLKSLRQIDVNQVEPSRGGFLDDFKRARQNGFLSLAAGRGFDPNYNPQIAGSQVLTVFPRMVNGGNLASAANRLTIQRGEAGTLAQTYSTTGASAPLGFSFFPNPLSLFAGLLSNVTHNNHNAAQVEVRRSWRNGTHLQANYTFAKSITDATALRGLDPALDNANRGL